MRDLRTGLDDARRENAALEKLRREYLERETHSRAEIDRLQKELFAALNVASTAPLALRRQTHLLAQALEAVTRTTAASSA